VPRDLLTLMKEKTQGKKEIDGRTSFSRWQGEGAMPLVQQPKGEKKGPRIEGGRGRNRMVPGFLAESEERKAGSSTPLRR